MSESGQASVTSSGRVCLAFNDDCGTFGGNSGSYTVELTLERGGSTVEGPNTLVVRGVDAPCLTDFGGGPGAGIYQRCTSWSAQPGDLLIWNASGTVLRNGADPTADTGPDGEIGEPTTALSLCQGPGNRYGLTGSVGGWPEQHDPSCSPPVCGTPVTAASKIYWTDFEGDRLQRANLDGTAVETLITSGLNEPNGIALDVAGDAIYWTEFNGGRIRRAALDGSNQTDLISSGISLSEGIALDIPAGKMYWAQRGSERIQRADLDGTDIELLTTFVDRPYGMALDPLAGKMYWTDYGGGARWIRRANLDGSSGENVLENLTGPRGVALDVTNSKLYWVDTLDDRIYRANIDGSAQETLISSGLDFPRGIALDLTGGKMYWTDAGMQRIERSNLDGSSREVLIDTGLVGPNGIAVDVLDANCDGVDEDGDGFFDEDAAIECDDGDPCNGVETCDAALGCQPGTPIDCNAGSVPDGDDVPGGLMNVDIDAAGDITLSWSESCNGGDGDYAVYEGTLGDFSSHTPKSCTTSGATNSTFTPASSSVYFLIVPRGSFREGSYGTDSDGSERPQGAAACLQQAVETCL
ncbi:hypothetical protein ABI59_11200 [Acidobacteria bacterium Mor1]|nr:hypothetical protein ABI59_11200 [Acidobacteria bacterium Mor1]